MIWVNGDAQAGVAANDRGVQFGDGCFTTAHLWQGEVALLPAHIQRLRDACARLLITGVDFEQLEQEMQRLAEQHQNAVMKVILTRGQGGRGYSAAGCASPTRIISIAPYPALYPTLQHSGATLTLSPIALSRNPLLAGLKHLNRLEQVLIRTHLEQTEAHEAVVLDTDGALVECCAANLFWRKGKTVFTPDLSFAGVAGLMRARVMQQLPALGYQVEQTSAAFGELASADEVFITNALMPLISVNRIDAWCYHSREAAERLRPHC